MTAAHLLEPAALPASWERSRHDHRLDPTEGRGPALATEAEIQHLREASAGLLRLSGEEMDRLHMALGPARYAVLLTGPEAVVLDHRTPLPEADSYQAQGSWTGGNWAEAVEGTNAVGTVIAEHRPAVVRGSEHYLRRNGHFTCIGAPIFDPTAGLMGSLTIACQRGELGEAAGLALNMVRESAQAIEQRAFRIRFAAATILLARPAELALPPILLAVDRDRRIVGADRKARMALGIEVEALSAGLDLGRFFLATHDLGVRPGDDDRPVRLAAKDGTVWTALATPPLGAGRSWGSLAATEFHTRPRWLGTSAARPADASPGGAVLAPHVLRKVGRHVDAHLDEPLPLAELAAVAGLGRSHFSEAFRGSTGMPPHRWVLMRRIERAKALLGDQDLSITDVALATGFSSSSHFAAAFRTGTGLTPTEYRAGGMFAEAV